MSDDPGLLAFAAWCGTTPEHAGTKQAWLDARHRGTRDGWNRVVAALEAERDSIRDEALERAAYVADAHREFCKYEADHGGSSELYERAAGAKHIAEKIRALKGGKPKSYTYPPAAGYEI